MNNGRFAIAIHILTLLNKSIGSLLSSDYIASSININPVLVRKEIAHLKKAGYIESKEGKNGGCWLSKEASTITLAEVFKNVYQDSIFSLAKNTPNPNCPIGKKINTQLEKIYESAEQAMLKQLSSVNLEDFSNQFK